LVLFGYHGSWGRRALGIEHRDPVFPGSLPCTVGRSVEDEPERSLHGRGLPHQKRFLHSHLDRDVPAPSPVLRLPPDRLVFGQPKCAGERTNPRRSGASPEQGRGQIRHRAVGDQDQKAPLKSNVCGRLSPVFRLRDQFSVAHQI